MLLSKSTVVPGNETKKTKTKETKKGPTLSTRKWVKRNEMKRKEELAVTLTDGLFQV